MENRLETSLPRYQPAITITRIYSPRVPCQGAKTRRHTRHPPSLSLLKAVSSRFARTLISCACYTHTRSPFTKDRGTKKRRAKDRAEGRRLFFASQKAAARSLLHAFHRATRWKGQCVKLIHDLAVRAHARERRRPETMGGEKVRSREVRSRIFAGYEPRILAFFSRPRRLIDAVQDNELVLHTKIDQFQGKVLCEVW